MLKVRRFINQLMSSNCYVVYDESYSDCLVIDPASHDCLYELDFFKELGLNPSYIILTHEHTDHTWGVNTLAEKYKLKVVCNQACAENLGKASKAYFSFYFNDPKYSYQVKQVDIKIEAINHRLIWHDHLIEFIDTPGHSYGSICIKIEKMLFTGDTWMQTQPYINKRDGSSEAYAQSMEYLRKRFAKSDILILPGHGESFKPDA